MVDQVQAPSIEQTTEQPSDVVKTEKQGAVSAEAYMTTYAHDYYEWVDGKVFQMAPVTLRHNDLVSYLNILIGEYFANNPIGRVVTAPFVMAVEATQSRREPDLQVILNSNTGQLTETRMIGPADICIEIVSAESTQRDHGEKLAEYEKGGVREYWIIDPLRNVTHFYRLDDGENYHLIYVDKDSNYQTPLLPKFMLHVPILWAENLPSPGKIAQAVQQMLDG